MKADSKVVELGANSNLTPEGAIAITSRESWHDVIILGYHKGDEKLVVRSSKMSRAEALWLIEHAKLHVMDRL